MPFELASGRLMVKGAALLTVGGERITDWILELKLPPISFTISDNLRLYTTPTGVSFPDLLPGLKLELLWLEIPDPIPFHYMSTINKLIHNKNMNRCIHIT